MKLATLDLGTHTIAARQEADGYVPVPGFPDVAAVLADPAGLEKARGASGGEIPTAESTLLRPITRPGKVFCIGLNYRNHILEVGMELPTHPTVFTKFAESLADPFADVEAPAEDEKLDWEGELVLVIGKSGRRIPAEEAHEYIAGYTVGNDFSMRGYQMRTEEWVQGKMWEASSAIGPVLVTADEFDPAQARITTRLNGEVKQDDSTGDLVFGPADLVAYLSTIITLNPGDLVFTGTPGGVGMASQTWMKSGDEISVEITGIGEVRNRIV
ncbi:fumarylacetoacetate hydrolase family protein [Brevibacterium samyangense]|uniref:Fumarylacetoacetate hydrolase family protein n=1 Tax=Brevibacterium samyangense TaxID=366888 RepID=A0ABP5ENF1_9MICO